jgi:hypothetical protein
MALSPEAQGASVAMEALDDDEKRVIVAQLLEANPEWAPKDERLRSRLWMTLIIGLFSIAVISIAAALVLVVNGFDSGPVLFVAGAVVAGVIGLFSRSPA